MARTALPSLGPALALALATASLASQPAVAQQEQPAIPSEKGQLALRADQVVQLFNSKVEPADIFTPAFRAAVADAQIKALSTSLTAQFGPAVEVSLLSPPDGTRAALEIRFERGLGKGGIAIDPAQDNRINELRFTSFDTIALEDDTQEKIAADLAALPGTVNAWFAPLDGGAPVISIGADTPLALGSTFKLYILAALAEDVKAGRRQWTDVVPLTEKSYPSGQLQGWPKGAPVTLHTLASLMISISDNTATDQLIKALGQDRILKLLRDSGHADPEANDPFLTTRALFFIKSDASLVDQWQRGPSAERRTLMAGLGVSPPLDQINAAFAGGPKAIDIEWFAAPADLARLFAHMRKTSDPEAFAIMAINPSATPAITETWDYIGYKGGSEPGVLNLTWLLTDKAGRDHVLTLGWNNPAAVLDDGKLQALSQRILLLAH